MGTSASSAGTPTLFKGRPAAALAVAGSGPMAGVTMSAFAAATASAQGPEAATKPGCAGDRGRAGYGPAEVARQPPYECLCVFRPL